MKPPKALRAEARELRASARATTDFDVVTEALMLAEELDRIATKIDGKSSNGHI